MVVISPRNPAPRRAASRQRGAMCAKRLHFKTAFEVAFSICFIKMVTHKTPCRNPLVALNQILK